MLLRKPLSSWISLSLLGVATAMIPLTGQLRRPSVATPCTMTEITERLSRCTPPLHVVRQFPGEPRREIWVCDQPRSREQLAEELICDPERVKNGRWQGIVFCQGMTGNSLIEDTFINNHWGKYGMRIGPFVFFGDPELLRRIRELLLDSQGENTAFPGSES